jgi:hypothetical protein
MAVLRLSCQKSSAACGAAQTSLVLGYYRNRARKCPCAAGPRNLELPTAGATGMCAELDALKRDAGQVLRELKKIRRSRDVSFHEDAELNRRKRESLNAVLKHLLIGHDGKPCPAGDRPIVRPAPLRW